MAEPVSSGAGAVAIKMYGLGVMIAIVIALGYLVVVMTRMPRSRSEWVVSLVTTVIGSIGGGGFIIQYFGMHDYAGTWAGMCAIGGLFFASGLPFWAVARWWFKYVNDREGANILDVAKEVNDLKKNL